MTDGGDPGTPNLPAGIVACLFDLDGVLTETATVHAAAWREMFDEFLRAYAERGNGPFVPFDPVTDYDDYVDGRPRADGTRTFLAARGIHLPEGGADEPPDAWTVHALSERKNTLVLAKIKQDGVHVYPGSLAFLRAVKAVGMPTAVVSSSANAGEVLAITGLDKYIDKRVDGIVAGHEHMAGKPAPDTYLAGARALDLPPSAAAVFEDALAGVEAGRAGAFGWVVGVDRSGQAEALRAHGADVVVADLDELVPDA